MGANDTTPEASQRRDEKRIRVRELTNAWRGLIIVVSLGSQCCPPSGVHTALAGFPFCVKRGRRTLSEMASRVALFFDNQNVYKCAREAFEAPHALASAGQISPRALADLIVARSLPPGAVDPRVLAEVRVYTGRPSQKQDSKGYAAARRQAAAMEKDGVIVVARTLRTKPGRAPQEKGVDVSLAIDFVSGAIDGTYDVGIIFSADTDLVPALEFIVNRPGLGVTAEVAAWSDHPNRSLSVAGAHIWCHRLSRDDYLKVQDRTNYTR